MLLKPLLLGCTITLVNLVIQVGAVTMLIRYYGTRIRDGRVVLSTTADWRILTVVMLFLFAGHILQFATWAVLFMFLPGEFDSFATAFYHSTVNFASLGYGDIVMSEDWRLLGAIEACNGVLMFGLSAATLFAVMQKMFERQRQAFAPSQQQDG